MEITSFGILTTNRWEVLFLIRLFRVKYTFSLTLLTYNQRTYIMEIVYLETEHFPLTGDFCTKCKKKTPKLFCSVVIMAIHLVTFNSY